MGHISLCVVRCYFTGQKHEEDTCCVRTLVRRLVQNTERPTYDILLQCHIIRTLIYVTVQHTPWNMVHLANIIVSQPEQFPASYVTERLISLFRRAHHLLPILIQMHHSCYVFTGLSTGGKVTRHAVDLTSAVRRLG